MSDKSTELQNLLIEKLLNDKPTTSGPSSISTAGILIIVTILIIIAGVVIYYIFRSSYFYIH